jgi:prepilin-type N-terminal cleavage/methylation domain-containing protein
VKRGFTLVELAVTLMVLVLAAFLIAPSVGRGLDGLRARADVSGFSRYLRAAREQAVTRGQPQQVRLEDDGRTLAMLSGDPATARSSRHFAFLLGIEPEPPSARTVTFQPQGLSSGGAFYLLAPGNRRYLVTVDPVTGRVTTKILTAS